MQVRDRNVRKSATNGITSLGDGGSAGVHHAGAGRTNLVQSEEGMVQSEEGRGRPGQAVLRSSSVATSSSVTRTFMKRPARAPRTASSFGRPPAIATT